MDFLKKLGSFRLTAMLIAGFIVCVVLAFLALKLTESSRTLLYTNLNPEDSSLISSRLEAMSIDYQIANGGKDILVPVHKALMLRMNFAQEGIPHSGSVIGYELFDKSDGLGTSFFVNNVNYVRALEGELARTISSIAMIESARVHIVLPKKELFSKGEGVSSASVVLRMRGGQTLSKQEVAGISHLIATAVSGLQVDNVTILDNHGKALKLSNNSSDNATAGTLTETINEYQHAMEERLKQTLEDMLEKSLGIGKVKANVSAEINFDREVTESETYNPDGQVVRSKRTTEESDNETEKAGGGELGITANAQQAGNNGKNKNRTDEVTNYEISKTITNKISENGRVKKLSIALLVDGNYQVSINPDTKEQETKYTPRTDDELNKIKALASSAVGFDSSRGDKIEVINMQFSEEFASLPNKEKTSFAWLKDDLQNIVQTLVIGTVTILVIMLVVRPVVTRALEMRKVAQEAAEAAEAAISIQQEVETQQAKAGEGARTIEEDLPPDFSLGGEDKRRVYILKQLNELIDKHPDESVSIMRNWLYSSD